jgi:hypothetical protein
VPDPPNHRVFIARQDRVMVVGEDSGKLPAKSQASMARMERQLLMAQGMDSPHPGMTGF